MPRKEKEPEVVLSSEPEAAREGGANHSEGSSGKPDSGQSSTGASQAEGSQDATRIPRSEVLIWSTDETRAVLRDGRKVAAGEIAD